MVLDELDYQFSLSLSSTKSHGDSEDLSLFSSVETQREIAMIRSKLLPLIAIEGALATELSGGVCVTGGRTGVYVRSGWKSTVTSGPGSPGMATRSVYQANRANDATGLAAKTFNGIVNELETLWRHKAVKKLVETRKLRLDESAPL